MVNLFTSGVGAISLEDINNALVSIDGMKSRITSSIFYDLVIGFKALKRLVMQQQKDTAEILIKWTAMYLDVQSIIDPKDSQLRQHFETSVPPALFYLICSMKYTTKDFVINELIVMARKVLANVQPITIERLANFKTGLISSIFESLNSVGDFITQTLLLRILFTISRCIHSQRVQGELEAQSMDDNNFKTKFTAAMKAPNFLFENSARDFLNYLNMSFIKTPSIFSFRCEVLGFGSNFKFYKPVTANHFWVDLNLDCCMLTFQADYKPPHQSFVHVTGNIKVSKMKMEKIDLIIEFIPPVQFSKRFPTEDEINSVTTAIAQLPIDEALRINANHILNYFNTPPAKADVATDRDETLSNKSVTKVDLENSLTREALSPKTHKLEDAILRRLPQRRSPCYVNTRRGNATKRPYQPPAQIENTREKQPSTCVSPSGRTVACDRSDLSESLAAQITMQNPKNTTQNTEGPKKRGIRVPASDKLKSQPQRNRKLLAKLGGVPRVTSDMDISNSDFDNQSMFKYLGIPRSHTKRNQPMELETTIASLQDGSGAHNKKVLQKAAPKKSKRRVIRTKKRTKRVIGHSKLTDNSLNSYTSFDDTPKKIKKSSVYSYEVDLKTQDIRCKPVILNGTISISSDHASDDGIQEKSIHSYVLLSEDEYRMISTPRIGECDLDSDSSFSRPSNVDDYFEAANDSRSSTATGFDHLKPLASHEDRAVRKKRDNGKNKPGSEGEPTLRDSDTVPEARHRDVMDEIDFTAPILPEPEMSFDRDRTIEPESSCESISGWSSAGNSSMGDSWLTKLKDAYTNLEIKYEQEAREHLKAYCDEQENQNHKDFHTKAYQVVKRIAEEHQSFIAVHEKFVSSVLDGRLDELREYTAAVTRFQKFKKHTVRALRSLANYDIEMAVRESNRNKIQTFAQVQKNIRRMEWGKFLSQHFHKSKYK